MTGSACVLVVDDVEVNLELLDIALSRRGHRVTTMQSAQDALESLGRGDRFDVILMDVQMPQMDGLSATRLIRQMAGPAARTPIVALTANAMASQIADCLDAGMDRHLTKPVNFPELFELIEGEGLREAATTRMAQASAPSRGSGAKIAPPPAKGLAALRDRYRAQVGVYSNQLQIMLTLEDPVERAKAIAALAHAIAGTSGALGFAAVSAAAMRLEADARAAQAFPRSSTGLEDAVAAFDSASRDAASGPSDH